MVRITKIYTRTGDDGQTGLGSGERVSKSALRVRAYGAVDEANAAVGAAIEGCRGCDLAERLGEVLRETQHDLFDLGADLCVPIGTGRGEEDLRVLPSQTKRLEGQIDAFNADMEPLTSFVLPGGTTASAALHVARTVVRRAEREVVALLESEPDLTNSETVKYLNRLSDLLFVLARAANGGDDVLWKPGANREG